MARSTAKLSHLRIAPRKVRVVADLVRGQRIGKALNLLAFTPKAAARPLAKLLRSALANAEQGEKDLDVDRIVVRTITVDQGPTQRRYMPRAMGRATRINKKTSHVQVTLDSEEPRARKATAAPAKTKTRRTET
jgi:large subunit ribosomal protein L22